ncbi:MAG: hypothetical protein ABIF10_00295 [Candidatus Woesearchaeota archaeon]
MLNIDQLILCVIIGTLAAIVYCLRVLVLMERKVARMEFHVEKLVGKILSEELTIERSLKKRK